AKAGEVIFCAHDDVADRVAASDAAEPERASFVGGPAPFREREVAAEARAYTPTHALAARKHVQCVALCLQSHVRTSTRRRTAAVKDGAERQRNDGGSHGGLLGRRPLALPSTAQPSGVST